MRASAYLQIAIAVVASTSPVAAAVPRHVSCNKEAIDSCVAATGQTGSACFGHLCAGRSIAADGVAKRQGDCTEENLFQCAILDWNEAQACFQQLCL